MSATTLARRPTSGTLAEVVDLILDKGLVIDAFVRVSLVGIELLTVDVRVVVASVDTYLHFAEAVNRLDLRAKAEDYDADLQDLIGTMREGGAEAKTSGAIEGASDKISEKSSSAAERIKAVFGGGDDEGEGEGEDEGSSDDE
jgi:gas vesicle structural protein